MSLPYLSPNDAASCPVSVEEIMAYVRLESSDGDHARPDRLEFVRTALVGEAKYWVWTYTESDATECYVFFRQREDGGTLTALTGSLGSSSVEDYLMAASKLL